MTDFNLIIIVGQEGAGKSTIVRALVEATPWSAQIDAEDVGTVNPWQMDDEFVRLLSTNVADLTRNFWRAGYRTVIAGSFVSNHGQYQAFREELDHEANVYIVHLCATKPTRDARRTARVKETSEAWRDMVDRVDPEDTTFASADADFRYLRIDNDGLTVAETVDVVLRWLPDIVDGGQPIQGPSA